MTRDPLAVAEAWRAAVRGALAPPTDQLPTVVNALARQHATPYGCLAARFTGSMVCVRTARFDVTTPLTYKDPAEAWEALIARGLVSPSWHADDGRLFVYPCPATHADQSPPCSGWHGGATPATLNDVATFATHHAAMVKAEALAVEIGARRLRRP